MTAVSLAFRYLISRLSLNLLTAFGVAIGVALVIAAGALSAAAKKSTQDVAGGYQLLVAAKGSPAQAVLSTLFFMEPPTGNIPIDVYDQLRADPGAAQLIPFNFGDSYNGHYIVGTTKGYRDIIEATSGRPPVTEPADRWADKPFEAVLGASVARKTGLKPGDTFVSVHGFVELPEDLSNRHERHAYTVVAVLKQTNTPADRAIFTSLDSAWIAHSKTTAPGAGDDHDHDKHELPTHSDGEAGKKLAHSDPHTHISALLIYGRGYTDVARFAAVLSQRTDVQAVYPGRVATQITSYMKTGQAVLLALAWLSIGIACVAVMISLLAAAIERRRQIATLRAIGAPRRFIFTVLLSEAGIISLFGGLIGILLGRAAAMAIAFQIEQSNGFHIDLLPIGLMEFGTVAVAMAFGVLAGSIPAYFACREDVTRHLTLVN